MPSVTQKASPLAHKSSTGMTIAFPEVCLIPATPGPTSTLPIPYPNIATTAVTKQQKAVARRVAGTPSLGTGVGTGTTGGVARASGAFWVMGAPSVVAMAGDLRFTEAASLRGMLNSLNTQLQNLPAGNPDQWQTVLKNYSVTAAALYDTITDD